MYIHLRDIIVLFVEDDVHPFKESHLRFFFVEDDVYPFKESYRRLF